MKIKNLHLTVRFNDCDLMGHVNNAVYLTYAEEARIHFFKQKLPTNWDWVENGIIIKKHEIVYISELFFGEIVEIETEIISTNNKSFNILHTIYSNKIIKTKIESVLVYFDYKQKKTKALDKKILTYLKL
jgi:acyl-CoA thioester hydrolase